MLKKGYLIPFSSLPPLSQDPIPFTNFNPGLHQEESFSWGDFVSHRERGCRANSFLSGLPQPHVHHLEGVGLMETCNRPFTLEQVCSSNEVQDGDQPVGSPCSSEG